jgi:hypothetical protein
MHRLTSLLVLVGILLVSSSAFAQNPFKLNMGVGLKGGLNGSGGVGVPENETFPFNGGQIGGDPEVYPMFGLGGAVGVALEARAFDIVGLETGLHLSYDNGNGYEDKNDAITGRTYITINQEQRTTALHIPLLLKLVVPGAVVRPVFGLGVEFVLQQSSTLEYDTQPTVNPHAIETTNYTLGMFTAGLEFRAGAVRIPLEFRAGYNLNFSNKASDRVRFDGNSSATATIVYNGAYQAHAGLFTGIIYDYDFLF